MEWLCEKIRHPREFPADPPQNEDEDRVETDAEKALRRAPYFFPLAIDPNAI
jgi:hypothetical protein